MNDRNILLTAILLILIALLIVFGFHCNGSVAAQTLPAIMDWSVVDADTGQLAMLVANGDVIRAEQLPSHYNFRFSPPYTADRRSVVVKLDGAAKQNGPEGNTPFSLFGDIAGKYNAGIVAGGSHEITGTTFSGWGTGPIYTSRISFTIAAPPQPIGATPFPKPVFPAATQPDATTLAKAPWLSGRTSFVGKPGTEYQVLQSWGEYSGTGFVCDLNGATVKYRGPSGSRLITTKLLSQNFEFKNGTVDLGPPAERRGFVNTVGTGHSFHDLITIGGEVVFFTNNTSTRTSLKRIYQDTTYTGYYLFAGQASDPLWTTHNKDWDLEDITVTGWLDQSVGGLGHVLRVYGVDGWYGRNLFIQNVEPPGHAPEGAAIRVQTTRGGFQTFENCTFDGYIHRLGPLNLTAADWTVTENVTFRRCKFNNQLMITSGARNFLFDQCEFDGHDAIPVSITDAGMAFNDLNHDGKRQPGEEPLKGWPNGEFLNCTFRSIAHSGNIIAAIDRSKIKITGGRAINPTVGYNGPAKFRVP